MERSRSSKQSKQPRSLRPLTVSRASTSTPFPSEPVTAFSNNSAGPNVEPLATAVFSGDRSTLQGYPRDALTEHAKTVQPPRDYHPDRVEQKIDKKARPKKDIHSADAIRIERQLVVHDESTERQINALAPHWQTIIRVYVDGPQQVDALNAITLRLQQGTVCEVVMKDGSNSTIKTIKYLDTGKLFTGNNVLRRFAQKFLAKLPDYTPSYLCQRCSKSFPHGQSRDRHQRQQHNLHFPKGYNFWFNKKSRRRHSNSPAVEDPIVVGGSSNSNNFLPAAPARHDYPPLDGSAGDAFRGREPRVSTSGSTRRTVPEAYSGIGHGPATTTEDAMAAAYAELSEDINNANVQNVFAALSGYIGRFSPLLRPQGTHYPPTDGLDYSLLAGQGHT